ncbi:hypothetical protein [Bartonella saheliensis]|uniref:hypothetical protein n=1 Tax=Bartonella saheliensis TaxID=1457016 RepID=UPI0011A098CE|nr:hypothetical protein [Bartonella saheliensis]
MKSGTNRSIEENGESGKAQGEKVELVPPSTPQHQPLAHHAPTLVPRTTPSAPQHQTPQLPHHSVTPLRNGLESAISHLFYYFL